MSLSKGTRGRLMPDRAMLAAIVTLAWPTMLEQAMQTAVQYIDTYMVGSLGTSATAAVGATATVSWLIGSTVSALGVGFLALISQALGARDHLTARRACAQAVTVTGLAGVIVTALTTLLGGMVPVWMRVDPAIRDLTARYFRILYASMLFRAASIILGMALRSAGDTKTPMRVGIGVNLLNVILNYLMIYPSREAVLFGRSVRLWGLGWGVEGAAAASSLAFAFGGIAITLALLRHKAVSPRGQSFRPDGEILRKCFKVAFPNMIQRFGTSLGYVVFAAMINSLGEIATAAHTVANTVESAFYIPGWGMQTAAATLAGNAYGARDPARFRRLSKTMVALEVALMIVSGAALFLCAEPLVRLFSREDSVIRLGTAVLRMVAVSEPFYGVPIVVEGMMQGTGRTVKPLVFNLIGMWGVRIAFTYICTQRLGMGLTAAWGCMIAHNLLLFFLFGGYFISGKWDPLKE